MKCCVVDLFSAKLEMNIVLCVSPSKLLKSSCQSQREAFVENDQLCSFRIHIVIHTFLGATPRGPVKPKSGGHKMNINTQGCFMLCSKIWGLLFFLNGEHTSRTLIYTTLR